ncbi:MAG: single-stranded-DNA-specific exonuclease RecJ [Candidatus Omnitrophica bacterium]|nr:single-stranded-DNA-specific exonuclease RecJ [Candidatus Omnitrophota bacterium]MBU1128614.1 single-stranded-DNA-specific exonuclease RecJ [Candidatus Omnitrophota bacterium]MBU1784370.1 single-stranded-DNA-specific exonuclease RecJ [Candidatus Omnitrophota bacterium]MBU1852173.1 single-stranded-DNA-specific exonuclease RecJ [Candidatus Omnitrophota bacterium]
MNRTWTTCQADPRLQAVLCDNLGITPLCAQLLINRNIRTPEHAQVFLFGGLSSCHDPFLMKDMKKGTTRIKKAIARGEKILIYGDYDVDGVASTALLSYVLKELGANYETFIPNRLEDGYGMNVRGVAWAREHGVGLIITVDCGINSFNEVACANDYGIDVIVTDHHEIKGEDLPSAYAIIDAHQPDCEYPFKGLAGVGVAYKLASALMEGKKEFLESHLDLVALGTVADVAPMNGENRILTKAGLKTLKNTDKCGLKALMDVARVKADGITSKHIGFALGPRINAMGRVGSANTALELLMCRDEARARDIAAILDKENRNRQSIEKDLLSGIVELVESGVRSGETGPIVLAGDGWHPGVLGIVASRLVDVYDVPAILISLDGDKGKGSGRSPDNVNLFEAIKEAQEHLIAFGGHEAACGLKIHRDNIAGFRAALNGIVMKRVSHGEKIQPELKIDLNLSFSRIGLKLVKELKLLMPYGPENVEPVFATSDIGVKNAPRDIGRGGFKFLATCRNLTCEAITFNRRSISKPRKGSIINLAYTPSVNDWGGVETIQLNIKDIQIV